MKSIFLQFFTLLFSPLQIVGQMDSVVLTADKFLRQNNRPSKLWKPVNKFMWILAP
ncbi:MAG: hypothetical protein P8Q41_10800 [Saprospiraceae bacterium]|jgi:hypothetical protein|nr:hypothetical protein [Saprospiraceae bacterium]